MLTAIDIATWKAFGPWITKSILSKIDHRRNASPKSTQAHGWLFSKSMDSRNLDDFRGVPNLK